MIALRQLSYLQFVFEKKHQKSVIKSRQQRKDGWHHRLDGHESEQAPGAGGGQGSLACYTPWGHKELDMTERLNWTELQERLMTKKKKEEEEIKNKYLKEQRHINDNFALFT